MWTLPLAAAPPGPGSLFSQTLPWLLALLGVVLVGAVVIAVLRRRLRAGEATPAGGFTLEEIRRLHAAGELTDEEFERAKAALIARVASTASENRPDEADEDRSHQGLG